MSKAGEILRLEEGISVSGDTVSIDIESEGYAGKFKAKITQDEEEIAVGVDHKYIFKGFPQKLFRFDGNDMEDALRKVYSGKSYEFPKSRPKVYLYASTGVDDDDITPETTIGFKMGYEFLKVKYADLRDGLMELKKMNRKRFNLKPGMMSGEQGRKVGSQGKRRIWQD